MDDLLVLFGGRVEILSADLALVLGFQPAHGGFDPGADGSAGEVVIGDLERLFFLRAGPRKSRGEKTPGRTEDFASRRRHVLSDLAQPYHRVRRRVGRLVKD
jgi:hypothetical protein